MLTTARVPGDDLEQVQPRTTEVRLQEFATMMALSPDAMVAVNLQMKATEWNVAAQRMFGWTRQEILGADLRDGIPADRHEQFAEVWTALLASERVVRYETERLHKNGTRHRVSVQAAAVREQGDVVGVVATFRRLSERRRRDRRVGQVLGLMPVAVAVFDCQATVTFAAGGDDLGAGGVPSLAVGVPLFGVHPKDLAGQSMLTTYADNPHVVAGVTACLEGAAIDHVVVHGGRRWEARHLCYSVPGGPVVGGLVVVQEIPTTTARALPRPREDERVTSSEVAAPMERDELTGLVGPQCLQERLAAPVPTGRTRALALLNVDAFRLVNETVGHRRGERLLQLVAQRLRPHAGNATLFRGYGDEFVVLLESECAGEELAETCAAMLQAVRAEATVLGTSLHLSMSAGLVSSQVAPASDLLTSAREALRSAKERGRDRAEWFVPGQRPRGESGSVLAGELRHAIEHDGLRLHYQPIVTLGSGTSVGLEALVRWERAGVGLVPPADFIELAERTGQIAALGAWVLQRACTTARELLDAGTPLRSMAVNVSAQQLADPDLADQVAAALTRTRCPAKVLVLEVTETAVMSDLDAVIRNLQTLKTIGVGLALDDFGTGYSSLLYLKHLPVDKLKIDRSFVAGLGVNPDDSAIVAATISLAHNMGVTCVAEGVETLEQLQLLESMGCDDAQGYLFSRPLAQELVGCWITERIAQGGRRARPEEPTEPAADVERILRMHTEAASLHTIAAALNVTGGRTVRGSRWSHQSVARVIARSQFPTMPGL